MTRRVLKSEPLLAIEGLDLAIGETPILHGIDLSIEPGRIMGLVGESGSGKSLTALAAMQLLPAGAKVSGAIRFDGRQLLELDEPAMCDLRGDEIGMVFQEPMTALNPVKSIGEQIAEGIRLHAGVDRATAAERARTTLEQVGLEAMPLTRYPHELSGGQRQRVGIAIACAMQPKLLIADEPTTALDVTIQAQILELLSALVADNDMALLLISHDLGVVADMADDITVLKDGRVMEAGPTVPVLKRRRHPYTRQLAEASTHAPAKPAQPVTSAGAARDGLEPLLSVRELVCEYPGTRTSLFSRPSPFRAIDRVSFDLFTGQTMGLVGESGCGKSTLARTLLGLQRPASGAIEFEGEALEAADPDTYARARRHMQVVFQDPYGSFNPRHKVERLVGEPLHLVPGLAADQKRDRVVTALASVGLSAGDLDKYPHEFSGGQRQRLAIARALVTEPRLIIADEPVSALDVSIRAQILDLLAELRDRLSVAYLFISHDLTVVRVLCDDVLVMKDGRFIERGSAEELFAAPREAYTRELIAAAPDLAAAIERRSAA